MMPICPLIGSSNTDSLVKVVSIRFMQGNDTFFLS